MMKKNLCSLHLQASSISRYRNLSFSCRKASDYLHTSILPTYHFQNCLPRLPIPKLEDTASRYLRSVQAIEGHPDVNKSSIENTKKLVQHFLENEGPKIHQKVVEEDKRNSHTSYICQSWFDMYLESRLPLPLNFNPFITFKRDPNEANNDQATRSTNFIIAAMKFQKTLNAEVLSPEVFYMKNTAKSPGYQRVVKYLPNAMKLRYLPMALNGAYPLDMSQFGNLFNSTRIPMPQRDELKAYTDSRHIIAVRNGKFYKVDTYDVAGDIMSAQQVKSQIDAILNDDSGPNDDSVAYFTTADRASWATTRNRLQELNPESLEIIDSAIFCLVLEDSIVSPDQPDEYVNAFLHGDGSSRWFDKSFSIIVSKNGEAALNFEHAWGDGVAVMRFFNDVFDESTKNPAISAGASSSSAAEKACLEFKLDDPLRDDLKKAKANYEEATGRLRVAAGEFTHMNKDYLKKKKVSPDGVMQLAIQAGHLRLYQHPTATYESCSTSAFKHGRTETLRSCTLEAQAAAKAIVEARTAGSNKLKDDAEYRRQVESLIRTSCKKHGELTKEAAMGQGFDRHMFALRNTAEKTMEISTPDVFKDPTYHTMNHIVLSTSTLASHAVSIGGFAPVVPDGFGVGYGVRDEMIGCNITSYDNRDVTALVEAIVSSFEDIYLALED